MIHYHGTPITPTALLREQLAGRHFCVPFPAPYQARLCHDIGQSVMLDNGAFSTWKRGHKADWPAFYAWAEEWLAFPTTWAVVPDVIDAGPDAQDALLAQWPFGAKGSPVWHMDEPIDRLVRLLDAWPRVCIGSTNQFDPPYRPAWRRRMDAAWSAITKRHRFLPWVHMLRGAAVQREGMALRECRLDRYRAQPQPGGATGRRDGRRVGQSAQRAPRSHGGPVGRDAVPWRLGRAR